MRGSLPVSLNGQPHPPRRPMGSAVAAERAPYSVVLCGQWTGRALPCRYCSPPIPFSPSGAGACAVFCSASHGGVPCAAGGRVPYRTTAPRPLGHETAPHPRYSGVGGVDGGVDGDDGDHRGPPRHHHRRDGAGGAGGVDDPDQLENEWPPLHPLNLHREMRRFDDRSVAYRSLVHLPPHAYEHRRVHAQSQVRVRVVAAHRPGLVGDRFHPPTWRR
mmetsp:Transcript_29924/g.79984  ORF Transcript_29924/g.79984 Transcript_29924/m.79984 type:complete len:217 (-) Transcript_29924:766-1416(-)